jgi:hypothetical protein
MHWLDAGTFGPRLLLGVLAGAWLWAIAYEVGSLIARRLLPSVELLSRGAIAAALGYAVLGTAVALLGVVHLANPLWVIGLLAVVTLVRIVGRAPAGSKNFAEAKSALDSMVSAWREWSALDKIAYGITGAAFVTAAIAAALPAVWWDPIAYHLPLALRALREGTFGFDPQMVQTAFPQLSEAAALPAYALAGSAGAAFATLGAGIALVILCARIAQQIAPGAGALTAALLASCPLWLWLAPTFYIDVPFALFVVGALAVAWFATDPSSALGTGVVGGLLAGAAAASKYPGLLDAIVVAAVLVIAAPALWRLRLAGFALGTAIAAAGWYARTWFLAGDPVYPILVGTFGATPLVQAFAERYLDMTRHWCGGGSTIGDALLLPWRLLTDPRSFCGDPGYALRLGAIFAIAGVALVRQLRAPAIAGIVLTGLWFATTQQWRFLLPAVCLMAIVTAVGALDAAPRLRTIAAGVLLALCAFSVLADWLPALQNEASNSIAPAFDYMTRNRSGSEYLTKRLETFAAADWLGKHAPGAKVVALDDVRDYYFAYGSVWANPYYQSRWRVDWAAAPAQRYKGLLDAGYALMVVNANSAYVRRTPTGVDWGVLAQDERSGVIRREFSADDVTVYSLQVAR